MDVVKTYSRRSLLWIILIMAVLCTLVESAGYFAMNAFSADLTGAKILEPLKLWFAPATSTIFAFFGLCLWIFLRGSLVKAAGKSGALGKKGEKKRLDTRKRPDVEERERKEHDKRMFLHLMSVLQREGRLLDFFSENLDDYEDDQIGAAVRSIHDNCGKTMKKYLTYKPVVNAEEEDEYAVQPGFDPGAIKLTGNVTGEPPFKGVVRHRGWMASKMELPTLSEGRNPDIISPAEIEII